MNFLSYGSTELFSSLESTGFLCRNIEDLCDFFLIFFFAIIYNILFDASDAQNYIFTTYIKKGEGTFLTFGILFISL